MNDLAKNLILWAVIAVVLLSVFSSFDSRDKAESEVSYSTFIDMVKSGQVSQVTIANGREISGTMGGNKVFKTYSPETDNSAMVGDLLASGVNINAVPPEQQSFLVSLLISWFPFIIIIGIWIFVMRQMQGGGGGRGAMSFGKSKAKMLGEDQINVTFTDVAGAEEAKEEVAELVEFLKRPR